MHDMSHTDECWLGQVVYEGQTHLQAEDVPDGEGLQTSFASRTAVLADAQGLLTCYGVGEDGSANLPHAVVELCFTSSVRFLQPGLLLQARLLTSVCCRLAAGKNVETRVKILHHLLSPQCYGSLRLQECVRKLSWDDCSSDAVPVAFIARKISCNQGEERVKQDPLLTGSGFYGRPPQCAARQPSQAEEILGNEAKTGARCHQGGLG